jgi:hypothetical protein
LREGNLRNKGLTAVGYDQDRSFMLVEIAGDELYFQAISRTGLTVDSGVIPRVAKTSVAVSWPALRAGHGSMPAQTVGKAIAFLKTDPIRDGLPVTCVLHRGSHSRS